MSLGTTPARQCEKVEIARRSAGGSPGGNQRRELVASAVSRVISPIAMILATLLAIGALAWPAVQDQLARP